MEYIILPAYPEESVLGYIMRVCKLSHEHSMKQAARHFFGVEAIQAPLIIPSNVGRLQEQCRGALGSADQIISAHTIAPALLPFLPEKAREALRLHLTAPRFTSNPFMYLGLCNRSTELRAPQLFCTACIVEDVARYGTGYWKRYHQLPSVRVCPRHRIALSAGCNACKYTELKSRHIKLPRTECWCGKAHVRFFAEFGNQTALDAEVRIATLLDNLLTSPLEDNCSQEQLSTVYRIPLSELGLLRGSYLDVRNLEARFTEHFSDEFLRYCGCALGRGRSWLANTLCLREPPRSVVRNALLIDFLFVTLDRFKEQLAKCAGVQADRPILETQERRRAKAADALKFEERKAKFRAILCEFQEQSPHGTRTDFQLAFGAAALWLRENDNEWYAKVLPPVTHSSEATLKRAIDYRRELDKSMAEHVSERLQSLCADDVRPRRLTAALLLRGHARSNEYGRLKDDLPKTSALIKQSVETPLEYKRRLAVWLAVHRNAAPDGMDSLQYAQVSTGLPLYEITALLCRTMRGTHRGRSR